MATPLPVDTGDFPIIVLQGQEALGGEQVGMASVIGQKPVVLNFWGAECLPCRGQLPELEVTSIGV